MEKFLSNFKDSGSSFLNLCKLSLQSSLIYQKFPAALPNTKNLGSQKKFANWVFHRLQDLNSPQKFLQLTSIYRTYFDVILTDNPTSTIIRQPELFANFKRVSFCTYDKTLKVLETTVDNINDSFYPYKLLIERLGSLNQKYANELSETLNNSEAIIEGMYKQIMDAQQQQSFEQLFQEQQNEIQELEQYWGRIYKFMQDNSETPFTYLFYEYDYSKKLLQKKKMGYSLKLLKLLGSNIQQFYSNFLKTGETGFEALKNIKNYFKFWNSEIKQTMETLQGNQKTKVNFYIMCKDQSTIKVHQHQHMFLFQGKKSYINVKIKIFEIDEKDKEHYEKLVNEPFILDNSQNGKEEKNKKQSKVDAQQQFITSELPSSTHQFLQQFYDKETLKTPPDNDKICKIKQI